MSVLIRRFLLLTIAGSLPVAATSQVRKATSPDARLIAALEEAVPEALRIDGAPGLTIALGSHGRIIWEKGFGFADLARKLPMTPATIARAGSMSKVHTATAVMQLVEQGVLGLDQPINRYLPDFKVTNPLGSRNITVQDLMTHTAGLSEIDARYADFAPVKNLHDYLAAIFARAEDKGPDGKYVRWLGQVGERASYSNIGITLLGYLVAITNPEHLSFAAYVRKHVHEPLGMKATWFPNDDGEQPPPRGLSTGYAAIGGMWLPIPRLWAPVHPAGTLYSTAGEHLRLVLAYLNGGSYDGHRILTQASVEHMLSPKMDIFGSMKVGLVWMLAQHGEPTAHFTHSGAYMYGWYNQGTGFPKYGVGAVVTVNRWPMIPGGSHAEDLIVDFIGSWLANEDANPAVERPAHSYAWKRSYVIGMSLGHSYYGSLAIPNRLTAAQVGAIADGGLTQPTGRAGGRWDPAGFRAGFDDITPIAADPAAVKAFQRSVTLKVHPALLDLIFADIGGRGQLPAP